MIPFVVVGGLLVSLSLSMGDRLRQMERLSILVYGIRFMPSVILPLR